MLKQLSSATKPLKMQKILAATVALSLALTACSNSADTQEKASNDKTGESNSAEVIRIATEGAYAPFNYTDSEGNLGGYDVDIANALCEEMKASCTIVAQDWDGIIPGLKAGKYDAIVAAMSVTPERQAQVDFTEPYFTNSLVFIANTDSDFDPSDESLISSSSIAAQRSTISSQWLGDTYPDAKAQLYDTLNNAFLDLEAGRVDAMVSDMLPAVEWLNKDNANFEIKGEPIDIDDNLAIAVRKGDDIKEQFDKALVAIKANGTYDRITEEHFPVPAK